MSYKIYILTLYWAGQVLVAGRVVKAKTKSSRDVTKAIKDRGVPAMWKRIGTTGGEVTILFGSLQDMAILKEALALSPGVNFNIVLEERDSDVRRTLENCVMDSESGLMQLWRFARER